MRIAFICNEYPPRQHGGIGTFVQAIAPAIAAAGHKVKVVQFGDQAGEEAREGIHVLTVRRCRKRRGSWFMDRLRLSRALALSAEQAFDVVEVPDFEGWLPFGLRRSAVVCRLHLSSTARTIADGAQPRWPLLWREARTLGRSDAWVPVSGESLRITRETFPGVVRPPSRTIFYPLRVDAGPSGEGDPRPPYVLFGGYVSRSKGADRLAEYARPVLESHRDLKLVYAGKIPEEDGGPAGIAGRIRETLGPDAAARCVFLGFVPRPRLHALMQRATCFAFPSRLETFGLVVGEAMLLGCPVITNRAPPFTEYIEHDCTGLLCGDAGEWVSGLRALVESSELRGRLAAAGRRTAMERFSVERCVTETLDFYREVLAARCGGSD